MNVRSLACTVLLLSAFALLSVGCRLLGDEATPTIEVVVIPTVGPTPTSPTATDISPAASGTPVDAVSPTLAAANPTATATAGPAAPAQSTAAPAGRDQRIQFGASATSATLENNIAGGVTDRYTLSARAGQTMSISLATTEGDATFELFTPSGTRLYGGRYWQGQLPASGDYVILASAGANGANYRLDVAISPLDGGGDDGGEDGGEAELTRIEFAAGTTATRVQGELGATEIDTYVLRAQEGQSVSVFLVDEPEQTFLSISGENGEVYLRSALGQSGWHVPALPATQDYYISVVATGGATSYTLEVNVSPLSNQPMRIQFAPGATTATVNDALAAGGDLDSYILSAAAGQEIRIEYSPASAPILIFLQTNDGSISFSSATSPLVATLPEDGDYLLSLSTPNAAGPVDYLMMITIE